MAQVVLTAVASYASQGYSWSQFAVAAASMAGSYIDNTYIFPNKSGADNNLTNLSIQSSTEGTPIPRIDGQIRLAGQLLWATKYKCSTTGGGKGFGGDSSTSNQYSISFAVGLSAGVVD